MNVMTSYPFLLKLLHERAVASPSFSFKTKEDEYRVTFSNGKKKTSDLVSSMPIRMFSVEHCHWRFFVKFTDMEGQDDYVLIEDFNDWLLGKMNEGQLIK